jgi:hypothetical protein
MRFHSNPHAHHNPSPLHCPVESYLNYGSRPSSVWLRVLFARWKGSRDVTNFMHFVATHRMKLASQQITWLGLTLSQIQIVTKSLFLLALRLVSFSFVPYLLIVPFLLLFVSFVISFISSLFLRPFSSSSFDRQPGRYFHCFRQPLNMKS